MLQTNIRFFFLKKRLKYLTLVSQYLFKTMAVSEISPSVSKCEGGCQSPRSVSNIVIAARLSACGEHPPLTRGERRLLSASVLDHYSQSKPGEEGPHNVTEPVSLFAF